MKGLLVLHGRIAASPARSIVSDGVDAPRRHRCAKVIAPAYVKPFVKRQKNDTADAGAIREAAGRPTMRFVAVKSETQQATAMIFKARDLLVRQRTATISALRGHLAEFGIIAPKGPARRRVVGLVRRCRKPMSPL